MRNLALVVCSMWLTQGHASPTFEADGWALTVSGQFRPRLTVDSGRDFVDTGRQVEREYVTQRTRLGVELARRDGPRGFIQLQDVRIWGEEASTLDYSARGLDLHQAYVDFPMLLLTARLGRQEIVLDDARLVGNVGWTQRARSFDAARIMVTGDETRGDAFIALTGETDANADGHVTTTGPQSWFGGLHAEHQFGDALSLSVAAYGMRHGPADTTRYTAGAYAKGKAAGLIYEGQGWYQFGDLAGDSIGAWMAAARAGYALPVAATPTLTLWSEVLSGDGTPTGAFDTLFATNHGIYGEMDVFIAIPKDTGALGLMDLGGRVAVAPTEYLGLHLDAHAFQALEPDAADETHFGTELDFVATWTTEMAVKGRALFGVFLPGEALRGPQGLPTGDLDMERLFFLTIDWTL